MPYGYVSCISDVEVGEGPMPSIRPWPTVRNGRILLLRLDKMRQDEFQPRLHAQAHTQVVSGEHVPIGGKRSGCLPAGLPLSSIRMAMMSIMCALALLCDVRVTHHAGQRRVGNHAPLHEE